MLFFEYSYSNPVALLIRTNMAHRVAQFEGNRIRYNKALSGQKNGQISQNMKLLNVLEFANKYNVILKMHITCFSRFTLASKSVSEMTFCRVEVQIYTQIRKYSRISFKLSL